MFHGEHLTINQKMSFISPTSYAYMNPCDDVACCSYIMMLFKSGMFSCIYRRFIKESAITVSVHAGNKKNFYGFFKRRILDNRDDKTS